MGFYPTDTPGDSNYEELNSRAVAWLSKNKVSGRNAKEKFSDIAQFANGEAEWLLLVGVFPQIDSCYTLAFATVLAAVGSYEVYKGKISKKQK